jgi:hypothetical protein
VKMGGEGVKGGAVRKASNRFNYEDLITKTLSPLETNHGYDL